MHSARFHDAWPKSDGVRLERTSSLQPLQDKPPEWGWDCVVKGWLGGLQGTTGDRGAPFCKLTPRTVICLLELWGVNQCEVFFTQHAPMQHEVHSLNVTSVLHTHTQGIPHVLHEKLQDWL